MAQSGKNKQVTFEQALEKLEAIVEDIEQGKIGLEESITKYEEGMGLIQHCRKVLADAEMKIQKLQADQQGNLEPTPFEPPEPEGADADED
ncbi:MAG TPA: exodeoxyribonuclease VII small subunit [Phycisphaerae bacterium]|nr:exodeoxyribonuclease VII small subunit [Phycisphaerae bacterium]